MDDLVADVFEDCWKSYERDFCKRIECKDRRVLERYSRLLSPKNGLDIFYFLNPVRRTRFYAVVKVLGQSAENPSGLDEEEARLYYKC